MLKNTLTFLFVLFLIGCSRGGHPLEPALTQPIEPALSGPGDGSTAQDSNWFLFGMYEMVFDAETESLTINRNRNLENWYDIKKLLFPPKCPDCVELEIVEWDPVERYLEVDSTVRNPTNLTVYPPRVVFLFPSLEWQLWSPYGFVDQLGYTDHFYDSDGPLRDPFKPLSWNPDNLDIDPDESVETTFGFVFPEGITSIPPIPFAVECRWPNAVSNNILPNFEKFMTGGVFAGGGGEITVWLKSGFLLDDPPTPRIDTSQLGGGYKDFEKLPDDWGVLWEGKFTNVNAPAGDYTLWIEVGESGTQDVVYHPVQITIPEESQIVEPYLETFYSTNPQGTVFDDFQAWGDYAYIDFDDGVRPVDFSDPLNPEMMPTHWRFIYALTSNSYVYTGDGVAVAKLPNWDAHSLELQVYDIASDPYLDADHPASRIENATGWPDGFQQGTNGAIEGVYGTDVVIPAKKIDTGEMCAAIVSIEDPYNPVVTDVIGPLDVQWSITLSDNLFVCEPLYSGQTYVYTRGIHFPATPELIIDFHTTARLFGDDLLWVTEWDSGILAWQRIAPGVWEELGSISEFQDDQYYAWFTGLQKDNSIYMATIDKDNYEDGWVQVDVQDPYNPEFITYYDSGVSNDEAGIYGDYLVLCDVYQANIKVYNLNDLVNPVKIVDFDTTIHTTSVDVRMPICVLAQRHAGVKVLDVTNPSRPEKLTQVDMGGTAYDIIMTGDGSLAYVSLIDVYPGDEVGIKYMDLTNPQNPTLGSLVPFTSPYQIDIYGNILIAAGDEIGFWDITDKYNPSWLGQITPSDGTDGPVRGMDIQDGIVFYQTESRTGRFDLSGGYPPASHEYNNSYGKLNSGSIDLSGNYLVFDTELWDDTESTYVYSDVLNWPEFSDNDLILDWSTTPNNRSLILGQDLLTVAQYGPTNWPSTWGSLQYWDLNLHMGEELPEPDWLFYFPQTYPVGTFPSGPEVVVRDGRLWLAGGVYDLIVIRLW